MNRAIRKCWRDASSLMVLAKRYREPSSVSSTGGNYDILLQTRTSRASFPNSVVFPGGVSEEADAAARWLPLFAPFGYTQCDFDSLHRATSHATPIFGDNPVLRHISLRITAIRETFEELGILICSSKHKDKRENIWASAVKDVDLKHWQNRVSKNPEELLNLCKEYNCYPDLWSLHYWSNWLTPADGPRRFDSAFFITGFENKPAGIKANSEVVNVEWTDPAEAIERSIRNELAFYPPQIYELRRLSIFTDLEKLIKFAKQRSPLGSELFFPVHIKAKDGILKLLPGDYLYPSNVDYYNETVIEKDNTISELSKDNQILHRFEIKNSHSKAVIHNYKPSNHVNMGETEFPVNLL